MSGNSVVNPKVADSDSIEIKSRPHGSLLLPNATVFASSFCVMVIELVAGRIIAGHLGSSLYTWTSVIGIVLAGLALGNYVGGRLADRFEVRRTLPVLFLAASATAISISIFNDFVGEMRFLWLLPWPARVASHVGLVFFLPSCFLGMISPVIAKMALDLGRETGRTIGNVYAWGVAGSILGTFVTGFYLVEMFGTTTIIMVVAAVLAAIALFYRISMPRIASA
jgi:MFS family permease